MLPFIRMLKNHCVYLHTFPNGKQYVGQATGKPERRWGKEGNGYKGQQILRNALDEYSWDSIKHEIVAENLTQEEADKIEKEYIQKLNTLVPYGYNVRIGGKDNALSTTNIVIQKLNKTIVNIFFNIDDASDKLNMSSTTIKKYCESGEDIGVYSLERFFDFPVASFYGMNFHNNSEHYDIQNFIWTKEDDNVIINNFKEKGYKWCADILDRTEDAIKRRASILGVTKKTPAYTIEEENFLRKNYEKYGVKYCSEKLGRSENAVKAKASKMHLECNKYYTVEEENYLKENYKTFSNKELAYALGRTVPSIESKLSKMGLVKKEDTHRYDDWLIENYAILGTKQCAEILNLTIDQVSHRARVLGVKVKAKTFGKSKYKYVQWDKRAEKWKVVIDNINGKKKQFGCYESEDEAGKVAIKMAKEYEKEI